MNQDQRAAFEAWYMNKHKKLPTCPAEWAFLKSENGRYVNQLTQTWFEIYQAALESPEVQALSKDAAYYRWLRANWTHLRTTYHDNTLRFSVVADSFCEITEADIDAAIIAAMEKQK